MCIIGMKTYSIIGTVTGWKDATSDVGLYGDYYLVTINGTLYIDWQFHSIRQGKRFIRRMK